LVASDHWRESAAAFEFRQGYLSTVKERTVRVRVAGRRGTLTIKGITVGAARREFEYEIPIDDARTMLDELCERPLIEKTRHVVEFGGFAWEIDEFSGVNAGLVVAEIELDHEDQDFPRPPWLAEEVTDDPRYFNANLIQEPFSTWVSRPGDSAG